MFGSAMQYLAVLSNNCQVFSQVPATPQTLLHTTFPLVSLVTVGPVTSGCTLPCGDTLTSNREHHMLPDILEL